MTRKEVIEEVGEWLILLKPYIDDDMKDADDTLPNMPVTIGITMEGPDEIEAFGVQSGDNSYSGAAYHHPHWGVGWLFRRSNCRALATELVDEAIELASQ